MMRRAPHGTRKLLFNLGHSAVVYSFGPWTAYTVNRGQLPFKIAEGTACSSLTLVGSEDVVSVVSRQLHAIPITWLHTGEQVLGRRALKRLSKLKQLICDIQTKYDSVYATSRKWGGILGNESRR